MPASRSRSSPRSLDKVVPAQYRDPEGHWYGISMRARVVYASKERVKQDAITYEELADPKWKGKICIRSGQHIYNNALFAALRRQARRGQGRGMACAAVKANLAQKPSGGDRETARDVAAGKCDIGIGNTYYWALMNNDEADKKAWADATTRDPADLQGRRHPREPLRRRARQERAEQGQRHEADRMAGRRDRRSTCYADLNYEYPVRAGIAVNPTIAGYGTLKPDPMPLVKDRRHYKKAAADARGQGRLRQLMRIVRGSACRICRGSRRRRHAR